MKSQKQFVPIIRALNAVNPPLAFFSLALLFLDYTRFGAHTARLHLILDLFFAFDFVIRLVAYPSEVYAVKKYGWADVASVVPILDFFIYIEGFPLAPLRFYRLLSFFRFGKRPLLFRAARKPCTNPCTESYADNDTQPESENKTESDFTASRVTKLVAFTLTLCIALFFAADAQIRLSLHEATSELYTEKFTRAEKNFDTFLQSIQSKDAEVLLCYKNGAIKTARGDCITTKNAHEAVLRRAPFATCVDFGGGDCVYTEGIAFLPKCGIRVVHKSAERTYNRLLLCLSFALLAFVCALGFFASRLFARDEESIAQLQTELAALKQSPIAPPLDPKSPSVTDSAPLTTHDTHTKSGLLARAQLKHGES